MNLFSVLQGVYVRFSQKHNTSYPVGKYNLKNRDNWLQGKLAQIPSGQRVLDAGAGELRNKPLCAHLAYFSHFTN